MSPTYVHSSPPNTPLVMYPGNILLLLLSPCSVTVASTVLTINEAVSPILSSSYLFSVLVITISIQRGTLIAFPVVLVAKYTW